MLFSLSVDWLDTPTLTFPTRAWYRRSPPLQRASAVYLRMMLLCCGCAPKSRCARYWPTIHIFTLNQVLGLFRHATVKSPEIYHLPIKTNFLRGRKPGPPSRPRQTQPTRCAAIYNAARIKNCRRDTSSVACFVRDLNSPFCFAPSSPRKRLKCHIGAIPLQFGRSPHGS